MLRGHCRRRLTRDRLAPEGRPAPANSEGFAPWRADDEALAPFRLLCQVRPSEVVLIYGTLPPAHIKDRKVLGGGPRLEKRRR